MVIVFFLVKNEKKMTRFFKETFFIDNLDIYIALGTTSFILINVKIILLIQTLFGDYISPMAKKNRIDRKKRVCSYSF